MYLILYKIEVQSQKRSNSKVFYFLWSVKISASFRGMALKYILLLMLETWFFRPLNSFLE